ncbi:amidohydrolase family protein [Amycolatopsis sp. FDAARGOS 1241]|uniref:amidohydrolase family protein n=1 Tax=Amycolatopsis sp. FDAARGOS 1241 TaxID=2778070 RepID=UPI002101F08C|nr:amidohydrolase family protein [Amycolatopsis sp. FDAARGOS 1241]
MPDADRHARRTLVRPGGVRRGLAELVPGYEAVSGAGTGLPYTERAALMPDLGAARIADVDRNGITTRVLSCLNTSLPAEVAPALTRAANDTAAKAVQAHPGRFAAFATLPTAVPDAAADELRRCVCELGFVGTMIMGRTDGQFLDERSFDPILRAASELPVPIHLHPAPPPIAVSEANYASDFAPGVSAAFRPAARGRHQERPCTSCTWFCPVSSTATRTCSSSSGTGASSSRSTSTGSTRRCRRG